MCTSIKQTNNPEIYYIYQNSWSAGSLDQPMMRAKELYTQVIRDEVAATEWLLVANVEAKWLKSEGK